MLADEVDFVIGVDTHRDLHTVAALQAGSGALVAQAVLRASAGGYVEALDFAAKYAPGPRAWAIEGTGSYGAGLARLLAQRGERVLEVGRPKREGRSRAKSDAIDALQAGRTLLGRSKLAQPRAGGRRETVRALVRTRAGALTAKRAGLCQLRALVVCLPEPLRGELRGLTRARLLGRCARLPRSEAGTWKCAAACSPCALLPGACRH